MSLGGPNIYPGIPSFPYIPPRCQTCGAELGDADLHGKWHADLDGRTDMPQWEKDLLDKQMVVDELRNIAAQLISLSNILQPGER